MKSTKIHEIDNVLLSENQLSINIDGKQYDFKLDSISAILAAADKNAVQNVQISPSGYGLYWPLLDESLSIDGLIGKRNSVESRPSHHQTAV